MTMDYKNPENGLQKSDKIDSLNIKNLLFNFLDQNKIHFYFLFLDIFKMSIFIYYK